MKKFKFLSFLCVFSTLLCGCSKAELETTESGIFVVDKTTYVPIEGKPITEDSKNKMKEWLKINGNNIIILNSDHTARIYGYFESAVNCSQVSGSITWNVEAGEGEREGYHYLNCTIQGVEQRVLTQNTKGEIYTKMNFSSSFGMDSVELTYKYVKEYHGLKAK